MPRKLSVRTFQIGTRRQDGEGLRIAVTRHPQRGVARGRRAQVGQFDVWFPLLAPSPELLRRTLDKGLEHDAVRDRFFAAYEREVLARAETRGALELLAAMAKRMPISIGCFCDDETRCHRSKLCELLLKSG